MWPVVILLVLFDQPLLAHAFPTDLEKHRREGTMLRVDNRPAGGVQMEPAESIHGKPCTAGFHCKNPHEQQMMAPGSCMPGDSDARSICSQEFYICGPNHQFVKRRCKNEYRFDLFKKRCRLLSEMPECKHSQHSYPAIRPPSEPDYVPSDQYIPEKHHEDLVPPVIVEAPVVAQVVPQPRLFIWPAFDAFDVPNSGIHFPKGLPPFGASGPIPRPVADKFDIEDRRVRRGPSISPFTDGPMTPYQFDAFGYPMPPMHHEQTVVPNDVGENPVPKEIDEKHKENENEMDSLGDEELDDNEDENKSEDRPYLKNINPAKQQEEKTNPKERPKQSADDVKSKSLPAIESKVPDKKLMKREKTVDKKSEVSSSNFDGTSTANRDDLKYGTRAKQERGQQDEKNNAKDRLKGSADDATTPILYANLPEAELKQLLEENDGAANPRILPLETASFIPTTVAQAEGIALMKDALERIKNDGGEEIEKELGKGNGQPYEGDHEQKQQFSESDLEINPQQGSEWDNQEKYSSQVGADEEVQPDE